MIPFSPNGPSKVGMVGVVVFLGALTAVFLLVGLDQLSRDGDVQGAVGMLALAGAFGTLFCVYVGLLVAGMTPSDLTEDHPLLATCLSVLLCLFVCVAGVFLAMAGHPVALIAAIGAPCVAVGLIVQASRNSRLD